MDVLDFVEEQGRRNAAFSLEGLELLSKRAHTMLALLMGGAGAAGGVALGHLGPTGNAQVLAGLGTVSLWWFCLAALLAFRALPTRTMRAPAGEGRVLLDHARAGLADYIKQARLEGEPVSDALALLREGELQVLQKTAGQYRDANKAMARVLDVVYRASAVTPLLVLAALALLRWWR